MKKICTFALIAIFSTSAAFAALPSLVYQNNSQGQPIVGTTSTLISYAKAGYNIKVLAWYTIFKCNSVVIMNSSTLLCQSTQGIASNNTGAFQVPAYHFYIDLLTNGTAYMSRPLVNKSSNAGVTNQKVGMKWYVMR